MAFTVLPATRGKHRRPRRGVVRATHTTLAGVAVLTAAGAFGTTALAAPAQAEPQRTANTAFDQAIGVTDTLANSLAAQADAQRKAADERKRAVAERRAKEERDAQERAARAEAERRRLNSFVLPVDGSYVSTPYRATSGLWSSGYHTGADFHAAYGTSVHAVGRGTVVEAGWGGSYGNNIVIRMSDGMYTQYGHLSSIEVSVGQSVTPGEEIGLSGATGNVTGPHLHFEVRTTPNYGSDVDPIGYLRSHGVDI